MVDTCLLRVSLPGPAWKEPPSLTLAVVGGRDRTGAFIIPYHLHLHALTDLSFPEVTVICEIKCFIIINVNDTRLTTTKRRNGNKYL